MKQNFVVWITREITSKCTCVISAACPYPLLYWFPSKWPNLNKSFKTWNHRLLISCRKPDHSATIGTTFQQSWCICTSPDWTEINPHSWHWPHTTHLSCSTWTYLFWYVIHTLLPCTDVFKLLHAGNQERTSYLPFSLVPCWWNECHIGFR